MTLETVKFCDDADQFQPSFTEESFDEIENVDEWERARACLRVSVCVCTMDQ